MASRSMKEVVESEDLKRFMDPRIVTALGHPVREHSLATFNERIASATEIGQEIGADVSSFYHHIELLEELGCIERVDTKQRRGGKEHFFRAKTTVFFDNKDWPAMPRSLKDDLSSNILQSACDEAAEASRAGTLNTGRDEHVSWTPGRFDQQAWGEAAKVLDEALTQIGMILDKSAERLAERNERGTPATVAIFGFKTDGPDPTEVSV